MFRLLIILAAIALSGCAASGGGLLRGTGVETMPPHGYDRLCREQPDFEACTP